MYDSVLARVNGGSVYFAQGNGNPNNNSGCELLYLSPGRVHTSIATKPSLRVDNLHIHSMFYKHMEFSAKALWAQKCVFLKPPSPYVLKICDYSFTSLPNLTIKGFHELIFFFLQGLCAFF